MTFFPRVGPTRAALLGGLHRLAIEDGHGRLGLLAGRLANLGPQGVVDVVPGAVLLPEAEVVEDNAVGWQVVRQRPPDTAVAGLVQDGIDDLPSAVFWGPSARLGLGHPVVDQLPLGIR